MEEFIGGYVFINQTAYPDSTKIIDSVAAEFDIDLKGESFGDIRTNFLGLATYFTIEKNAVGYYLLGIKIRRLDWLDLENSSIIDRFKQHWVRICESTQAEFAYFGNYEGETEIVFRDEYVLVPMLSYEINSILQYRFWLTYISHSVMEHWTPLTPMNKNMERLQSGAILISSGRGRNPVSGD